MYVPNIPKQYIQKTSSLLKRSELFPPFLQHG